MNEFSILVHPLAHRLDRIIRLLEEIEAQGRPEVRTLGSRRTGNLLTQTVTIRAKKRMPAWSCYMPPRPAKKRSRR